MPKHTEKQFDFLGITSHTGRRFLPAPPVSNTLYGDYGKYCFTALFFQKRFPHTVVLNIIHRQENVDLIKCVNELETGKLSDVSIMIAFLHSFMSYLE